MPERFFDPGPFREGTIRIRGDEARHLARVRRIPVGAVVEIFDGSGDIWRAEVSQIDKDEVHLRTIELIPDAHRPLCKLTLATVFPKGDRVDWLIEKATELGVSTVLPLRTERSVVDPRSTKLDRLRRLVIESSKQGGRARLMEIAPALEWKLLANQQFVPNLVKLFCHPGGSEPRAWPAISSDSEVVLAIGPEGGFSADEAAQAEQAGWQIVGLGPTILRIETAAIAGACAVFHRCEPHKEQ